MHLEVIAHVGIGVRSCTATPFEILRPMGADRARGPDLREVPLAQRRPLRAGAGG